MSEKMHSVQSQETRSGVSIVVPVFNSEGSLRELVARLEQALIPTTSEYEIVLVNDGSQDASWNVLTDIARTRPSVRGINLMRNFGQHNALLAGVRAAAFDVVVTMDDDLQNPPEEIPRLLAALQEGYDVVYGAAAQSHYDMWRALATYATKLALKGTMGVGIARKVSPFRAFRTELRRAFSDHKGSFISIDVLLTWGAGRFTAVPVRHDPRRTGVSNYNFRRLATHAMNMATGFSAVPLQLASMAGLFFTLLGGGVFTFVLVRYLLEGTTVPGFPFLASIISLFAGAQLFALGIIGEYLSRMHFRLLEKPPYVVREQTSAALASTVR